MGTRRWAETFAGGAVSAGLASLNARYPWSHNDHFHGWVIANLPEPCRTAFDDRMPGAEIRHRLGFRHTIAWSKAR